MKSWPIQGTRQEACPPYSEHEQGHKYPRIYLFYMYLLISAQAETTLIKLLIGILSVEACLIQSFISNILIHISPCGLLLPLRRRHSFWFHFFLHFKPVKICMGTMQIQRRKQEDELHMAIHAWSSGHKMEVLAC